MIVDVLPRFTKPNMVPLGENPQFFLPKPVDWTSKRVPWPVERDCPSDPDFRPRWWPGESVQGE